jgi:DNA adenine methylase
LPHDLNTSFTAFQQAGGSSTSLICATKPAGGKESELKYIYPAMPLKFNRFYEPFLGGGAVYFSVDQAVPKLVNDASPELIDLYEMVSTQNKNFPICL